MKKIEKEPKWPDDGSPKNRCEATNKQTGERCKRLAVTGYNV